MRNGKPETPAEKFGYYVLGPLVFAVLGAALALLLFPVFWVWFGH